MKAKRAESPVALAHEHRLAIFRLPVEQGRDGLAAGAIAEALQHLHRAGLIAQLRESRSLIYSVGFAAMNALVGFLTEHCCSATSCSAGCEPAAMTKPARRPDVAANFHRFRASPFTISTRL